MALDVAASEACSGDVGLSALADAGAAGGAGDEVGVAFAADLAAEVGGQVGSGALGDLAGEVYVALGLLGVMGERGLCLLEEGVDPFQDDLGGLFGHRGLPFCWVWGLWDIVYKSMVVVWCVGAGWGSQVSPWGS